MAPKNPKEPNSKSALGIGGSTTGAVLVDINAAISNMRQSLNLAVQEVRSLNQALQTTKTLVGSLQLPGQSSGGQATPNQVAPNPKFTPPASQAGGQGGGGQGGGGTQVAPGPGGFGQRFGNAVRENAIPLAAGALGAISGALPSAGQAVEAQLLMQRAAYFNPSGPGGLETAAGRNQRFLPFGSYKPGSVDYESIRALTVQMANAGTVTNSMDTMRALVAAQSLGITGPNITRSGGAMGNVSMGVSNVSNLMPGLGVEGTMRAYAGMQAPRNVNMLRGIGIRLRDENGNMKSPELIIDDFWRKISRDVSSVYGQPPTEEQILISLQPGNALDSMLNMYFGNDPMARELIANGILYKAKTRGAPITKKTLKSLGGTTEAVLAFSNRNAVATAGLGQVANAGSQGYTIAAKGLAILGQAANMIDQGTGFLQVLTKFNSGMSTVTSAGGNLIGNILNMLTSLIPFMAEGGSADGKSPYIVGEKGPELFVPKSDGVIVPNSLTSPFRKMGGPVKKDGNPAAALHAFLVSQGLTEQAAVGVVGNLVVESGLRTKAEGDRGMAGGSSIGIAQWREGRRDNLLKYADEQNLDPYSMEAQQQFLIHELKNYKSLWKALTSSDITSADAAARFMREFERPKDQSDAAAQRRANAGVAAMKGKYDFSQVSPSGASYTQASGSPAAPSMVAKTPFNLGGFNQPALGFGSTARAATEGGSKSVVININGAKDAKAVANEVAGILGQQGFIDKAVSR